MLDKESQKRRYEGPARIEAADIDQYAVNKDRALAGKRTQAEVLTLKYGERGVGWDMESAAYDAQNHIDKELHRAGFDLAKQAMCNWLATGEYILDDGTPADGLKGTVAPVPRADLVVYPDGDMYAANTKDKQ